MLKKYFLMLDALVMNLKEFLIIDACLFFIGFLIFSISRLQRSVLSQHFNKNQIKETSSFDIPKLDDLLEMEKFSRKNGSNIDFDSLIGTWKFISVWKRRNNSEDIVSSFFLRQFSACLLLDRKEEPQGEGEVLFKISNSIEFGVLSIKFNGFGNLQGKQPLLSFYFENIELKVGTRSLLKRDISISESTNRPFFALIGLERNEGWLSARGRGGGLALWRKD